MQAALPQLSKTVLSGSELGRELIKGGWSRVRVATVLWLETKFSAQNELVRSRPS
jgi:hypothetical protein